MYILANGRLITRDSALPYLEDGGVAIDGERIAAVGSTAQLRQQYPETELVDARGGVIMPGLINAHTHIYSALARGLAIDGNSPTSFLEVLEGTWWAIDRRLTLAGTRASADALYMDCIKQGVTTIFDHHASFGEIPGSLFQIAESARRFGVRSCLCYEVSDRDGAEKADQAVRENRDFLDWCEKHPSSMLAAMFGGHALFTISDATFEKMANANSGRTGFHIHVSEGMNDVYDSLRTYGRRPVQRLQDHPGPLHPREHGGDGAHPGDRDHVREQPGEQHGQRRWLLPGAPAHGAGDHRGPGYRRLHQRHAGEPEGRFGHSAPQRLPAQRGLVRGHGHALQK